MRVEVLGLPVDVVAREEAVRLVMEAARSRATPFRVVTLNPLMALAARKNRDLREAIRTASLVVPDGVGALWAVRRRLRKAGAPEGDAALIPGIDLMIDLLDAAEQGDVPITLLGSREKTLAVASDTIKASFPRIRIRGRFHGYFDPAKESEVVTALRKLEPGILFVGMGTPRQEVFLWKNAPSVLFGAGIGVGGAIDIFGAKRKRAPEALRRRRLEWVWRVLPSPSRWAQVPRLLQFVLLVLLEQRRARRSRRRASA